MEPAGRSSSPVSGYSDADSSAVIVVPWVNWTVAACASSMTTVCWPAPEMVAPATPWRARTTVSSAHSTRLSAMQFSVTSWLAPSSDPAGKVTRRGAKAV